MKTATNGQGYVQGFTGGYIYASALGTFALDARAQAAFAKAGGVKGLLGWPTAAPVCDTASCILTFQDGVLYLPATGTAVAITDSRIATYYSDHGGPSGALGHPTTATTLVTTTTNGHGNVQGFSGGYVYATALGTYAVMAPMQAKFKTAGWVRGPLGFPKGDEVCTDGTCTQAFAHGTLTTP
jgi:uncharacterized protein with LGFP repeats